MADWAPALAVRIGRAGRAVLVTIAHAAGSTPREAGTAMIVTAEDTFGTIGGGHLEFEAIRIARDALSNAQVPAAWLVRFPLAARLGQCCGGVATLAFAAADAAARTWLDAAVACARTATAFALVSRIGGAADAPAHLVVTADHATGSLGDAALDSAAVALARPRVHAAAAGAALCAVPGRDGVTLLVHVAVPQDFTVLVFGNGHVGRALVQVLATTPARIRWIDGREAAFPAAVAGNVDVVVADAPADELADARPGTYVVVTTHSHALDYEIVAAALARGDWRYLGVIGSHAKRAQFEKRWAARGGAPEAFARVTCPIGAGAFALRGKEPGVIAVAVAAEILALREKSGSDSNSLGGPARGETPQRIRV
ncbi:MAG: xanthine dehydrogenase accessory protein XdhC [Betaproteobacteria bacterium]|nr:xanthine dehydrogenase accessory protein XdhC [Betaproteobacteria bacterium]